MLKNILIVGRKLASAALNFLIVYFETIALPMSWALGGTIMFTDRKSTRLNSSHPLSSRMPSSA